jgi:hypothetical protein
VLSVAIAIDRTPIFHNTASHLAQSGQKSRKNSNSQGLSASESRHESAANTPTMAVVPHVAWRAAEDASITALPLQGEDRVSGVAKSVLLIFTLFLHRGA